MPAFLRTALTSSQRSSSTMPAARPSSLPFYQTSHLANLEAQILGFITQVLTLSRNLDHCRHTALFSSDAHLALSAIKALGRHPSGSAVLASDSNLSTLLAASKNFKDSNLDASLEALRCIANALLLIETARSTLICDSVNGGEYAVLLLEVRRPEFITLSTNASCSRNHHHQMSSLLLHVSSF